MADALLLASSLGPRVAHSRCVRILAFRVVIRGDIASPDGARPRRFGYRSCSAGLGRRLAQTCGRLVSLTMIGRTISHYEITEQVGIPRWRIHSLNAARFSSGSDIMLIENFR